MSIPYGNKGPDFRIRLTARLGSELRLMIRGGYTTNMADLKIAPHLVEPLLKICQETTHTTTGITLNLGLYEREVLHALRKLFQVIERYCCHVQVARAAKARRRAVDTYLGISAVDQLAEVASTKPG